MVIKYAQFVLNTKFLLNTANCEFEVYIMRTSAATSLFHVSHNYVS